MKKILIFFFVFIVTTFTVVADWGATRAITGNNVVLTVSPGDGFDVFTITETVTDATVESKPSACGLAGNVLTCDFEGTASGTLSYTTTGSGTVTGEIVAVNSVTFVSGEKEIIGEGNFVVQEEVCTPSWSCDSWTACVAGTQTRTCTDQNNCEILPTDKPAESQSCEEAVEELSNLDVLLKRISSVLSVDGAEQGYEYTSDKLGQVSKIAKALRAYFASP